MNAKVLFPFLLLAVSFRGFSQESKIILTPDKEISATITLNPIQGNGDAINLPVVLTWNKKENSIDFQFKGINAPNRFIYFFTNKNYSFEEIKKLDKQIWFSRDIKKHTNVEKCLDHPDNIRWKNDFSNIKESSLGGQAPLIKCEFRLALQNLDATNFSIPMRIYVASKENYITRFLFFQSTSKRDRKIEYMAKVSPEITLLDVCESPGLKSIIEELTKEMEDIRVITTLTTSETEELSSLSCEKIKKLNNKETFGEDKKYSIKDEQYIECKNLEQMVEEYNAAIDTCDNAVSIYNEKLEKRKKACRIIPPGCELVKAANKQLMDLYYRIEQSEKNDLPSFEPEYREIRKKINDQHKICVEYPAYKEWCNAIDKLLKK